MAAESPAPETPNITLPRDYNAATDLIGRNLAAGRGDKLAFVDDSASCTYRELSERVDRAANALRRLGLEPEQRVLLCLLDTIDFPTVFLGAIKAGLVPIPVNTLMTTADYDFMLRDSRARALIVSSPLLEKLSRFSLIFRCCGTSSWRASGLPRKASRLFLPKPSRAQTRLRQRATTFASGFTPPARREVRKARSICNRT